MATVQSDEGTKNWQAATEAARDVDMSPLFNFRTAEITAAPPHVIEAGLAAPVVGNDIMVATPDSVGTQLERAELQLAQENGRTSHTTEDIERMMLAVEARVKQMMAAGASDEEILAAVTSVPGVTPELSQLAIQAAEQQLAPDQFNLFSTRNQEQEQDRSFEMLHALFTAPAAALAADTEKENPREALQAAFSAPVGDLFRDKTPEQEQSGQKSFAEMLAGVSVSKELLSMNAGQNAAVTNDALGTQLAGLGQQRTQEGAALGA